MSVAQAAQSAASAPLAQNLSEQFSKNANEALAKLIDKVVAGVDQATDFLAGQIPDVIHQLLVFNLVWNLAWFVGGLIGVVAIPFIMRKLYVMFTKNMHPTDKEVLGIFGTLFSVAGCALSLIAAFTHLDWLKIWLAPKIWLIEYAVELAKSVTR